MADVLDLSFCPLKTIEEVCSSFLLLYLGRLWFSNEVDDLKEAQYSEEVRQVVQLFLFVFVGYTCEMLARFGDSLALHHSGDQKEGGAVYCCVQA